MTEPVRIKRDRSLLLVVDIQARLAPAVMHHAQVIARVKALIQVAGLLDIPVYATEHCPDRIGPLVPELRDLIADAQILKKVQFCCTDEAAIRQRLTASSRTQILVTGMEAHVCALQSALGLQECGFHPYFVGDAVGSRHVEDHAAALNRLRDEGVRVVATEMVIFEWLERADAPAFRTALGIIKSL
jgi:isochorismate hydrolase